MRLSKWLCQYFKSGRWTCRIVVINLFRKASRWYRNYSNFGGQKFLYFSILKSHFWRLVAYKSRFLTIYQSLYQLFLVYLWIDSLVWMFLFRNCEICGASAINIAGEQATEVNNGTGIATAASTAPLVFSEPRSYCQGRRVMNFLLACMVFAFIISWLFHFKILPWIQKRCFESAASGS